MGIFSFFEEIIGTTEELLTDTPKTIKEKAPELASFVGKNAVNLGQKALTHAGMKIAQLQSEEFTRRLHDTTIDPEIRREMLDKYITRKTNAANSSLAILNAKLENPALNDGERRMVEQEIRKFEDELRKIEHEGERLAREIS